MPPRITVSTWATSPPTWIFAASVCARCSDNRAKNDTVKPAGLGGALSTTVGVRRALSEAATAVAELSATVVSESNVTGTSSDAARGRNPVHQNGNQKSDAPWPIRLTI